ncbi:MAG: hypothetical protein M3Y74_19390 [Chloroflexota bacterium]|nr:hypothetical protein [Chloroflexota bacterium]
MTDAPHDRYAALRARAATRKQATVQRLTTAIEAIEIRGEGVTVEAIKKECGLDHRIYSRDRNDVAYAVFRQHAAYFNKQEPQCLVGGKSRKRRLRGRHNRAPRDLLLDQPRSELIALVHMVEGERDVARAKDEVSQRQHAQACAERDQAETYHRALLAIHMQCEDRIFDLERRLARMEEGQRALGVAWIDGEHAPS